MKSTLTEKERRINQRLDAMNHAPYFEIFVIALAIFCLFTVVVLLGVF
jgi:hypothetical protein